MRSTTEADARAIKGIARRDDGSNMLKRCSTGIKGVWKKY